jgi:hypothetical protein
MCRFVTRAMCGLPQCNKLEHNGNPMPRESGFGGEVSRAVHREILLVDRQHSQPSQPAVEAVQELVVGLLFLCRPQFVVKPQKMNVFRRSVIAVCTILQLSAAFLQSLYPSPAYLCFPGILPHILSL